MSLNPLECCDMAEPAKQEIINPLVYSIIDTGRQLGLSRSAMYELMQRGEIASLKIGRRRLIEGAEIRRFIATKRAG